MHDIVIILLVIAVLFVLCRKSEPMTNPILHITKGLPGMQCGTAFVNMAYDHSEPERLFKTCPKGYKCRNNICNAAT